MSATQVNDRGESPTAQQACGPVMALGIRPAWSTARTIRCVGVVIAVSALFTAAANWGWDSGRLPVPAIATMLFVMLAAGSSLLLDGALVPRFPLIAWAAANAVIAMSAFLWSSGSDVALQEVNTHILSSLLLVACVTLMTDPVARSVARKGIVVVTLGATALHVWEITHPLAFSTDLGRSAGFHVNPNIAGAALITGMLVGLPAVPARLRELYVLLCGVGVLTTLSRGALLCYGVTVALLTCWRALRGSRLLVASTITSVAGLSLAGALLASGHLGYFGGGAEGFVRQRLSIGSREEFGADASASSRSQLAMQALELFGERPITGHGVGATLEWREPESTHNIYVRQLAEYGLLGAWLAPALLLIGWRGVRRGVMPTDGPVDPVVESSARVFVLFVGLWGCFSHNVLDDAFVLIGMALVAGGTRPTEATSPAARAVLLP